MDTHLYRGYKIVPNDRPNFREADVFLNGNFAVAYVFHGKSGNRVEQDLFDECYNVIDEYIAWKEEQFAHRSERV